MNADLQWLKDGASPATRVGIGLLPGDARETEVLSGSTFCRVSVFREPGELLEALSTLPHKYACIRTPLHPPPLRSASSPYSVSTPRSRALRERRIDALDTTPYLRDGALSEGVIDAAVRGSLPAGPFLSALEAGPSGVGVRRIALLALPGGRPFLLGPVGIDEGRTLAGTRTLIEDSKAFCSLLGWEPRVAVLSSGRSGDAGRGREIGRSIRRGERLSRIANVRHFHINIEEAVEWANCVIAPDGVTPKAGYRRAFLSPRC